jgi:hypothetical protein
MKKREEEEGERESESEGAIEEKHRKRNHALSPLSTEEREKD